MIALIRTPCSATTVLRTWAYQGQFVQLHPALNFESYDGGVNHAKSH
jgi:hypothetical protein